MGRVLLKSFCPKGLPYDATMLKNSIDLILQEAISSSFHIEEKLELQSLIRMYSINVPLVKSVNFTHKAGDDDIEYVIVEADYDPILGLLLNL